MSVVKIPCVLIATIGLYRCFTPPNVAAKAEQVSRESIPDRAVFAAIPFLKPFGVRGILSSQSDYEVLR